MDLSWESCRPSERLGSENLSKGPGSSTLFPAETEYGPPGRPLPWLSLAPPLPTSSSTPPSPEAPHADHGCKKRTFEIALSLLKGKDL